MSDIGGRRAGEEMKLDLSSIAAKFQFDGTFLQAKPHKSGHINDTFIVQVQDQANQLRRYVLQRINHYVFQNPQGLMRNIQLVTEHLRAKIIAAGGDPEREALTLVPTNDGEVLLQTSQGEYWRAYVFIERARTYQVPKSAHQVYGAARAFGNFQRMLIEFPAAQLHETIPNFHNTPKRFADLLTAVSADTENRVTLAKAEIEFAEVRAVEMSTLMDLLERGELFERVIHNDTKFNNVMIDDKSGEGICVIDLDTVMPGLLLYDFGDLVRSAANPAAEDERDLSQVRVDLEVYEQIVRGYLDAARGFLSSTELNLLAFSARLMTLECGIRFLTDYLNGDTYFKVQREGHNLDRCRTQFVMVEDMEGKEDIMNHIAIEYWREVDGSQQVEVQRRSVDFGH
jgi:Ser/Thr protein kinase RdoA (MazF antagonist)